MNKTPSTPSNQHCSFVLYDCNEDEYEQGYNNVDTASEQDTDNVDTESEQDTNSVPTTSEQRKDRNRTYLARANKRPQETHWTVYQNYQDIVKLLNQRNFVRVNTSNTYKTIQELPLSRAPIDLTDAINKCGYPVTRDELAKIYTAANVCQRVSKFAVWAICITACLITSMLSSAYYKWQHPTTQTTVLSASIPGASVDLSATIREFEKKYRFTFYPYRKGVAEKEIAQSGDYSPQNIEIILQTNMAAQLRTIAKNKKK